MPRRVSLPLALCACLWLWAGQSVRGEDRAAADPRVQAALKRAVATLRQHLASQSGGEGALITMALLKSGVPPDSPEIKTFIEKIASQGGGATRQQLREATAKPKAGRPKHYTFAYRPPTKAFNLKISFAKSRASSKRLRSPPERNLTRVRDRSGGNKKSSR